MHKNITRIALIVNPWAGIGGELALKGSDGECIRQKAIERGLNARTPERVLRMLECLLPYKDSLHFISFPSYMGELYLEQLGFQYEILSKEWEEKWSREVSSNIPLSHADDTQVAARQVVAQGVDILLFAGGDGTARDISLGIEANREQVVLGIPCGVKIQSAVYGRSPESSAALLIKFLNTSGVGIAWQEVRDIDEDALRAGKLASRYFSELLVPVEQDGLLSLQAGKQGSSQLSQSEMKQQSLIHEEIAAYLVESLDVFSENSPLLIIGAGNTTRALKRQLGNEASLLGVDVFLENELIAGDVSEKELLEVLDNQLEHQPCKIIVSVIGGQGCILGRGSQPISARVINRVLDRWGDESLMVLATEAKLAAIPDRNLFVDTGDVRLDQRLSGSRQVIVDYDKRMLCKVLA